jgi:hypothetical protein
MNGLLWVDGPAAPWSFLVATLGLGGLAAFATGRAIALAWRPFPLCFAASALLAGVSGFLHYALFAESALPITRIAAALATLPAAPGASAAQAADLLRHYAAAFVILSGFATAGFRTARARSLRERYGAL